MTMSKEIQTKYENQLPKPEGWRFDRIFGYITGTASIAGLVGAPFIRPVALLFQSTHPRRVRHKQQSNISIGNDFNPRTHEGCDCHLSID